jgi:hypothetical protein
LVQSRVEQSEDQYNSSVISKVCFENYFHTDRACFRPVLEFWRI